MGNNDDFIFDGDIVSGGTTVASADSRGLMYGDGIFDTLRVYSGSVFFFDEHFERTIKGLQFLGINPPDNFTERNLRFDIRNLLNHHGLLKKDAIVRIQLWRDGTRGYLPDTDSLSHYIITASECPSTFENPSLATVKTLRIPSRSLPSRYKFTNSINYIRAAQEARDKGADDALMQTIDGHVSETTKANIYWKQGSTVFTPHKDCDLLPGITREAVIHCVRKNDKLKLKIGHFPLESVLDADAVWMCNSVRELLLVRSIDGKEFDNEDKLFTELNQEFISYRRKMMKPLV